MPRHWLARLLNGPDPYTARRPGVLVNGNVPNANIRAMRKFSGEPDTEWKRGSAASTVIRDDPSGPTAVLHFAPEMGFDTDQLERIAEQLGAAVAAMRGELSTLSGVPAGGVRYPGAVVLDEDGPASVHTNGAHAVPVLRLRGFSDVQRKGVAHEVSHLTSNLMRLERDATHDQDSGTFASVSVLSGMGR